MIEVRLSPKKMAEAVGVVYETVRGIVKGDRPPSIPLLQSICRVLDLDFNAMSEMLAAEQVNRKYGHLKALTETNSELRSIQKAWPLLRAEQREHVLLLIEKYAQQQGERPNYSPRFLPRPVRKN